MKLLLFQILFIIPIMVFAQNSDTKREKIQQLKIAFITSEINLSSDESSKFWPIYNEADDKIYDIKKSIRNAYIKYIHGKKEIEISDDDAKKFMDITIEADKKIAVIKEALIHDLGKAIGYKRITKLKYAEDNFKQKLLDQYRKKK